MGHLLCFDRRWKSDGFKTTQIFHYTIPAVLAVVYVLPNIESAEILSVCVQLRVTQPLHPVGACCQSLSMENWLLPSPNKTKSAFFRNFGELKNADGYGWRRWRWEFRRNVCKEGLRCEATQNVELQCCADWRKRACFFFQQWFKSNK